MGIQVILLLVVLSRVLKRVLIYLLLFIPRSRRRSVHQFYHKTFATIKQTSYGKKKHICLLHLRNFPDPLTNLIRNRFWELNIYKWKHFMIINPSLNVTSNRLPLCVRFDLWWGFGISDTKEKRNLYPLHPHSNQKWRGGDLWARFKSCVMSSCSSAQEKDSVWGISPCPGGLHLSPLTPIMELWAVVRLGAGSSQLLSGSDLPHIYFCIFYVILTRIDPSASKTPTEKVSGLTGSATDLHNHAASISHMWLQIITAK